MLTALSIRDVVLIERLDLQFGPVHQQGLLARASVKIARPDSWADVFHPERRPARLGAYTTVLH